MNEAHKATLAQLPGWAVQKDDEGISCVQMGWLLPDGRLEHVSDNCPAVAIVTVPAGSVLIGW